MSEAVRPNPSDWCHLRDLGNHRPSRRPSRPSHSVAGVMRFDLNSEVRDFRAASELFVPSRRLNRADLETWQPGALRMTQPTSMRGD